MADNLTTATIDVRANTRGLEKDILKALKTVELSQINTKKSSQALGRITGQVSEFNKSLEASNARVIAFGASAGVIFAVEKAFSSLISSTIDVEKKLADINVLLNASSSTIQKFGDSLFGIAKNTAQSFSEVADAATELARQGLGIEETLKRTNAALILTRLSGLDAKSSVEALTATLNSFSGSGLDAVEVINKLANVDAAFAVSSADLANAISRVGSTAVDAGVSLDELIALVTSAQQTTARGGAVIGNSFKTIFTRLQRGKVQELLGSLGVDTNEGQSAVSLLQQLATTYDTLGAAQKSYIAEQVGGVFQINILKAALSDLGKEYSIYGRALDTSLTSTDQAIRRNELLNQTVSALSSQAYANLEQAASKIGSLVFEPNAKGFLAGFNDLLSSFNNIDMESAGGKLMAGFFKGIGDFIGGPGAVLATAVLVKLFSRLTQFAAGSAKELLGTNKAAQQQAAIEQSILSILQKNSQFTSQILSGKMTTVQAEKELLNYLTAQSNILREQERLSKTIGANLRMAGVSVGASGIPMVAAAGKGKKAAASGYVPNFAADQAIGQAMENAGAKEHGYKAGKARKTRIHDGNGKSFTSFVNSKEEVKTFTNVAGKKATIVRPPNGFGENTQYAAGGFVPNFIKELDYKATDGDSTLNKTDSRAGRLMYVDAVENNQRYGPEATKLAEKILYSSFKNAKDLEKSYPGKAAYDRYSFLSEKLSSSLIESGMGVPDIRYSGSLYDSETMRAMNRGVGIWNSKNKRNGFFVHPKAQQFIKQKNLDKALPKDLPDNKRKFRLGSSSGHGTGKYAGQLLPEVYKTTGNKVKFERPNFADGFIPNFAYKFKKYGSEDPIREILDEKTRSFLTYTDGKSDKGSPYLDMVGIHSAEKGQGLKLFSKLGKIAKRSGRRIRSSTIVPQLERLQSLDPNADLEKVLKAAYPQLLYRQRSGVKNTEFDFEYTQDSGKGIEKTLSGSNPFSLMLKSLVENGVNAKSLRENIFSRRVSVSSVEDSFAKGFVPNFASGIITGDALKGNEYKAALNFIANSNKPVRTILGPSGVGKTTRASEMGGSVVKSFQDLGKYDSYILDRADLGFPKDKSVEENLRKIFDKSQSSGSLDVLFGSRNTVQSLREKRAQQGDKIVPDRAQLQTGSGGVSSFVKKIRGFKEQYPDSNFLRMRKSKGSYQLENSNFADGFVPNFASTKASDTMTRMVMEKFYPIRDAAKFKEEYAKQSFKPAALKALYRERVEGSAPSTDLSNRAAAANKITSDETARAKVKDLGKIDYTMIHATEGSKPLSSEIASYKKKDKKTGEETRYIASLSSASLDNKKLNNASVQQRVGDALVDESNKLSAIFNPSGGAPFSDYKQLSNSGSVMSAAGTVFESAVRQAFKVPAQGQTARIDFPNPSSQLRSFFHNAPGDYEAKISNSPDNLSSALSKYVAVKGLAKGYVPNFAKSSGLSFLKSRKDEFGYSGIHAILGGKSIGSLSYSEDKRGVVEIGDFTVDKNQRGKGYGTELYKEAIKRNKGKKMKGQLLPQMNRVLEKIKKGEAVSAETLYPQIKRADLAKSSVFEVFGHKGMQTEKMTRDQFSSFVNTKINELKKDPKKLQSYFGNIEADEYGGLGVDLQTQHASGFIPNFLDVSKGGLPFGVRGRTNYGSAGSKTNIQLGTGAESGTLAHELFHSAYSRSTFKKAEANPNIGKFLSSPRKYAGSGMLVGDKIFKNLNKNNLIKSLGLNPIQLDFDGKNPSATYSGSRAVDEITTRIQEKVFRNKGDLSKLSADEGAFIKNLEEQGIISNKRLSNVSRRSQEGSKFRNLIDSKFTSVMGGAGSGFVPNFASQSLISEINKRILNPNVAQKLKEGQGLKDEAYIKAASKLGVNTYGLENFIASMGFPLKGKDSVRKVSSALGFGFGRSFAIDALKMGDWNYLKSSFEKNGLAKSDFDKLSQFAKTPKGESAFKWGFKSKAAGFVPNFANITSSTRDVRKKAHANQSSLNTFKIVHPLNPKIDAQGRVTFPDLEKIKGSAKIIHNEGMEGRNVFNNVPSFLDFVNSRGNKQNFFRRNSFDYVLSSAGYVPNFADALNSAIGREQAAGLSKSQIYVDQHSSLKNPGNPMGLMVANRRDEPTGGFQGIARARKEGVNPKSYGSSRGFVPNFASPANQGGKITVPQIAKGLGLTLVKVLLDQYLGDGVLDSLEASGLKNLKLSDAKLFAEELRKPTKGKHRRAFEKSMMSDTEMQRQFPEYYKGLSAKGSSSGFIPNFSSALNDAIAREQSSGLSKSQIYVDKHSSLKNKNNPMGLMVANRRDEPGGGIQGIKRAKKEGRNPKTYGAAAGFVPNFAGKVPGPPVSDPALLASKNSIEQIQKLLSDVTSKPDGSYGKEEYTAMWKDALDVALANASSGGTSEIKVSVDGPSSKESSPADSASSVADGFSSIVDAFASGGKADESDPPSQPPNKPPLGPAFTSPPSQPPNKGPLSASPELQKAMDEAMKAVTKADKDKAEVLNQSIGAEKKSIQATQEKTKTTLKQKLGNIGSGALAMGKKAGGFISNNSMGIGFGLQAAAGMAAEYAGNDDTGMGRGVKAGVGGMGNIASFTGMGAQIAGPWGAAAGFVVGLGKTALDVTKALNTKVPDLEKALQTSSDSMGRFSESGQKILQLNEQYADALTSGGDPAKAADIMNKTQQAYAEELSKLTESQRAAMVSAIAQGKGQEAYAKVLEELQQKVKADEASTSLQKYAESGGLFSDPDKKLVEGLDKTLVQDLTRGMDISSIQSALDGASSSLNDFTVGTENQAVALMKSLAANASPDQQANLEQVIKSFESAATNTDLSGVAEAFIKGIQNKPAAAKSGEEAANAVKANTENLIKKQKEEVAIREATNARLLKIQAETDSIYQKFNEGIKNFIGAMETSAKMRENVGEFKSTYLSESGANKNIVDRQSEKNLIQSSNDQLQIGKYKTQFDTMQSFQSGVKEMLSSLTVDSAKVNLGETATDQGNQLSEIRLSMQQALLPIEKLIGSGDYEKAGSETERILKDLPADMKAAVGEDAIAKGILNLKSVTEEGNRTQKDLVNNSRKDLAIQAQQLVFQKALGKLNQAQNYGGAPIKDIINNSPDAPFNQAMLALGKLKATGYSQESLQQGKTNAVQGAWKGKEKETWGVDGKKPTKGMTTGLVDFYKAASQIGGESVLSTESKDFGLLTQELSESLRSQLEKLKIAGAGQVDPAVFTRMESNLQGLGGEDKVAQLKIMKELGFANISGKKIMDEALGGYSGGAFEGLDPQLKKAFKETSDEGTGASLLLIAGQQKQTDSLSQGLDSVSAVGIETNKLLSIQPDAIAQAIGAVLEKSRAQENYEKEKTASKELDKQYADTTSQITAGDTDLAKKKQELKSAKERLINRPLSIKKEDLEENSDKVKAARSLLGENEKEAYIKDKMSTRYKRGDYDVAVSETDYEKKYGKKGTYEERTREYYSSKFDQGDRDQSYNDARNLLKALEDKKRVSELEKSVVDTENKNKGLSEKAQQIRTQQDQQAEKNKNARAALDSAAILADQKNPLNYDRTPQTELEARKKAKLDRDNMYANLATKGPDERQLEARKISSGQKYKDIESKAIVDAGAQESQKGNIGKDKYEQRRMKAFELIDKENALPDFKRFEDVYAKLAGDKQSAKEFYDQKKAEKFGISPDSKNQKPIFGSSKSGGIPLDPNQIAIAIKNMAAKGSDPKLIKDVISSSVSAGVDPSALASSLGVDPKNLGESSAIPVDAVNETNKILSTQPDAIASALASVLGVGKNGEQAPSSAPSQSDSPQTEVQSNAKQALLSAIASAREQSAAQARPEGFVDWAKKQGKVSQDFSLTSEQRTGQVELPPEIKKLRDEFLSQKGIETGYGKVVSSGPLKSKSEYEYDKMESDYVESLKPKLTGRNPKTGQPMAANMREQTQLQEYSTARTNLFNKKNYESSVEQQKRQKNVEQQSAVQQEDSQALNSILGAVNQILQSVSESSGEATNTQIKTGETSTSNSSNSSSNVNITNPINISVGNETGSAAAQEIGNQVSQLVSQVMTQLEPQIRKIASEVATNVSNKVAGNKPPPTQGMFA